MDILTSATEYLGLTFTGMSGGSAELNVECPGGFLFQWFGQQVAEHIFKFLAAKDPKPPFTPSFYRYQAKDAVVRLIRNSYKSNGNSGLLAVVAEANTHGKDGEITGLMKELSKQGINTRLVDPVSIASGGFYNGQKIGLAFRDITVTTLVEQYLKRKKPLDGLTDLAKQNRIMNPFGTTPAGTRNALTVLSRRKWHLPGIVSRLTLWSDMLTPQNAQAVGGNPNGYVLKREGTFSGRGILIGGIHNAEIIRVLNGNLDYWTVQRKLPQEIWSDTFTIIRQGKLVPILQTLDARVFFSRKGSLGLLTRFNEHPPSNVGGGGGVQGFVVVATKEQGRQLRKWYRQAIENLKPADVLELEHQVADLCQKLGHWYINGPIRYTLEPRIFTQAEVAYLNNYGRHLWKVCKWLTNSWENNKLRNIIQLTPEEQELTKLQPFKGQPALLASDLLINAGIYSQGK